MFVLEVTTALENMGSNLPLWVATPWPYMGLFGLPMDVDITISLTRNQLEKTEKLWKH